MWELLPTSKPKWRKRPLEHFFAYFIAYSFRLRLKGEFMKTIVTTLLLLGTFSAFASDIAKSFDGKYELKSGTACEERILDVKFRNDGEASNCLFGGGPRLSLTQNDSLIIKCLDHKKQQAWMDNYRCNFVSDARSSISNGNKVITERSGRKCFLASTKWSSITTYTLKNDKELVIKSIEDKATTDCEYSKVK